MVPLRFVDRPDSVLVLQAGLPLAVMRMTGPVTWRVEFLTGWPTTYLLAECRACVKAAFRAMWQNWVMNSPSTWDCAS
ncbi:MAG: hypothetical protein OXR67_08450 [Chloroflexota bacterium]|nr:hypothetical protein [Chloroflexota bacterium]